MVKKKGIIIKINKLKPKIINSKIKIFYPNKNNNINRNIYNSFDEIINNLTKKEIKILINLLKKEL